MVGTRHETISRIIGRLETDGVAYFSGRQVTIPSVEALAAEIDACFRVIGVAQVGEARPRT